MAIGTQTAVVDAPPATAPAPEDCPPAALAEAAPSPLMPVDGAAGNCAAEIAAGAAPALATTEVVPAFSAAVPAALLTTSPPWLTVMYAGLTSATVKSDDRSTISSACGVRNQNCLGLSRATTPVT